MADLKVLQTQHWLNETYGNHTQWNDLEEDGLIGWKTIYGMIRGLQIELGITTLSDNFGDGTLSALKAQYPVINPTTLNDNIRRLAQSALWCHGFQGGNAWGIFDANTNSGIKSFMYACGLANVDEDVDSEITPKMLKALMTLDAYSLLVGGTADIREAQRWINGTYRDRKQALLPCDGIFNRGTQQGLLTVIQYELGLTDAEANGNFGPTTKSRLKAQGNLSLGSADSSTKHFVHLFQSALRMNGYAPPLTGQFDSVTVTETAAFQSYAELPGAGAANFATWASLLISTGDETRAGTAADMSTPLTASWCASLYAAGYRTVGRYLTVDTKRYAPKELDDIFDAGLKTFPIMQGDNSSASQFTYEKGRDHSLQALRRMRQLGFTDGITVFFPVDFDASNDEIALSVIPFFEGVKSNFSRPLFGYRVGVYGTRNVCTRIINAGLAEEAFIASMSWGWGGNLGFPLPPSWSYDQIRNGFLPGTTLEIDTDVQSTRARPADSTDVRRTPIITVAGSAPSYTFDEDYFWYISELTTRAELLLTTVASAAKVALYFISYLDYNSVAWQAVAPALFTQGETIAYSEIQAQMSPPVPTARSRMTHWAASTRIYLKFWDLYPPGGDTASLGDLGAWGLDLVTAYGDYLDAAPSEGIRQWLGERIGRATSPHFDGEDLVADIDAYLAARMLYTDPNRSLDDAVRSIEISAEDDSAWRYHQFVDLRFDGSLTTTAAAGKSVFTTLWGQVASWAITDVPQPSEADATQIGLAFADALKSLGNL